MNKTGYILICLVISLLFCQIGSAATCGENGEICPGLPGVYSDRLDIHNSTVFCLKAGEEQDIVFTFYRYPYMGTGNISYTVSETPLNVTVPAEFVTTRDNYIYPGMIKVHADPSLSPGNYSFSLNVIGTRGSFSSTPPGLFFVNVTPREKTPVLQMQSSLPIVLPVLAIVVLGIFYWGIRGKRG
jgi:hypothetical protein